MSELFGLFAGDQEIPLMGIRVDGDIIGRGARVKIAQRFMNTQKESIEAVYKFPLPESSAVCGFHVLIDGKVIKGEVEEREKAFEKYDEALAQGHGAYLLDEERPNILTLSVGNLKSKAEAVIEIDYVTLLDTNESGVRFFLPTTISPRYIPKNMPETDGIPEGARIRPEYAESVPYGLSLALNIHHPGLIAGIESPSHPVRVSMDHDPVIVETTAESVKMDRDFILNIRYKDDFQNCAYRYKAGGDTFYQVDLYLKDRPDSRPERKNEYIFVLDCSGSMQGDSIIEARKALEILLKGLDIHSVFNVYRFGSVFHSVFTDPEPYDEKSLERAIGFLRNAGADLGGTEMLKPLENIYSKRSENERIVVLLTDGEVGNEKEILDLVRKNDEHTRFFSVGIGMGPNELLIKGLSRAGNGSPEFISPGERIEPKVIRLFRKMNGTRIQDFGVLWKNSNAEQAPQSTGLFAETGISLFARIPEANGCDEKKIRMKMSMDGREEYLETDIVDCEESAGLPVPVLWARERIRDLEESGVELPGSGSRQVERKEKWVKEAIIGLSKKYNLLSSLTSFISVELREEKDKSTGEMKMIKVPVLVTRGWHGMDRRFNMTMASIDNEMILQSRAPFMRYAINEYKRPAKMKSRVTRQVKTYRHDEKLNLLMDILSTQEMMGGMALNQALSEKVKIDLHELEEAISGMTITIDGDRLLIVSTALLLTILEKYFSAEESSWKPVIGKTEIWLKNIIVKGNPRIDGMGILEWAEKYVLDNISI